MNNNFLTLIALLPLLLVAAEAQVTETDQEQREDGPKWVELDGDELESQLSINPSDIEETGKLEGRLVLFSDFCIQARDHVMGDVKRSVHQLVGSVASLFLGSFDKLGIDAKTVRAAAESHRAASANQNDDGAAATRRAQAIRAAQETQVGDTFELKEEEEQEKRGGGFPNPFGPIIWAISAIGSTIGHQVMQRLDQLSRVFGLDKLQAATGGACDRIGDYERHLRAKFAQVRDELAKELDDDQLRGLKLEQVPCMTMGRVLRLQGVCRFGANLQQHPLLNLLLQGQKVAKFVVENRNLVE